MSANWLLGGYNKCTTHQMISMHYSILLRMLYSSTNNHIWHSLWQITWQITPSAMAGKPLVVASFSQLLVSLAAATLQLLHIT
jgi:hypothetical protein